MDNAGIYASTCTFADVLRKRARRHNAPFISVQYLTKWTFFRPAGKHLRGGFSEAVAKVNFPIAIAYTFFHYVALAISLPRRRDNALAM